MKKLLVFLAFIANACVASPSQFLRVNPEWKHQSIHIDLIYPSSNDHEDWIQAHLYNVVAELSLRSFDGTPSQIKNRASLLHTLETYARNKKFPQNDFVEGVRPVFIDAQQTHCAVGYLMQQSGYESLAQQINTSHRLDYIRDIHTEGVQEWAEQYGFTIDELAWIQPGYQSNLPVYGFTSGVNGPVHDILEVSADSLLIGGAFSQIINGSASHNLAWIVKENNQWRMAAFHSAAANGPVFALHKNQNGIYIGGAFTQVNGVTCSNICKYDYQITKNIQSLPALNDTVLALETYQNELFAGGTFTGLIQKLINNSWMQVSTLAYGNSVRAMAVYNSELYFGGDFDVLTGAYRRNILKYGNGQEYISGMGCLNPVNTFTIHQGELYAGCDFQSLDSTRNGLVRLDSFGDWNTLIYADSFGLTPYLSGKGIYDLVDDGSSLYALGNFTHSTNGLIGYSNPSTVQLGISGSFIFSSASPVVSGIVYKGIKFDNDIKIGGSFSNSTTGASNIGQFKANPQSITKEFPSLTLYPNPTNGKIYFPSSLEGKMVQVYLVSGQVIKQCKIHNASIDLSALSNGNYLLLTDGKWCQDIQIVK
jgi:hypothetical protein